MRASMGASGRPRRPAPRSWVVGGPSVVGSFTSRPRATGGDGGGAPAAARALAEATPDLDRWGAGGEGSGDDRAWFDLALPGLDVLIVQALTTSARGQPRERDRGRHRLGTQTNLKVRWNRQRASGMRHGAVGRTLIPLQQGQGKGVRPRTSRHPVGERAETRLHGQGTFGWPARRRASSRDIRHRDDRNSRCCSTRGGRTSRTRCVGRCDRQEWGCGQRSRA